MSGPTPEQVTTLVERVANGLANPAFQGVTTRDGMVVESRDLPLPLAHRLVAAALTRLQDPTPITPAQAFAISDILKGHVERVSQAQMLPIGSEDRIPDLCKVRARECATRMEETGDHIEISSAYCGAMTKLAMLAGVFPEAKMPHIPERVRLLRENRQDLSYDLQPHSGSSIDPGTLKALIDGASSQRVVFAVVNGEEGRELFYHFGSTTFHKIALQSFLRDNGIEDGIDDPRVVSYGGAMVGKDLKIFGESRSLERGIPDPIVRQLECILDDAARKMSNK